MDQLLNVFRTVKDRATGPMLIHVITKKGKGYVHEIEEVHNCLSSQKGQSDMWSLNDSLNLIELMDEVRKQVGVVFPQEEGKAH